MNSVVQDVQDIVASHYVNTDLTVIGQCLAGTSVADVWFVPTVYDSNITIY